MTEAPDVEGADAAALRRSPLHDRHVGLGAKLADFGGWEMPIEYPGGGVLKEHQAVREAVGVFDVSHLGKARVAGPGAADFLNTALTNDLAKIGPGQAQYTMCCDDATGGVVDDLIAYLIGPDDVLLVPNAANTAEVVRRLAAAAPTGVSVEDVHEQYGVLAVQGPRSAEVIQRLGLPAEHGYMSFAIAPFTAVSGVELPVVVCRSGYTGEKGYELVPRWEDAGALWDAILAAGADLDIRPCGLGARDTLRTEMGYPLHGHELSPDITPVQARAGWAVGWSKAQFWGRDVLSAEKAAGPRRTLRGLDGMDRGIPRAGMTVFAAPPADVAAGAPASSALLGAPVGETTSGTFSPTLRHGIALALLDRGIAEGDEVVVDVRGRPARFRVVRPPFVQTSTA